MKKISNIFKYKTVRPTAYKEMFGVNQLSACGRNGSYDSWDFVGTMNEVHDYEKRWCSQGTNGFGFLGIEILKGFKGQANYIGRL